MWNSKVVSLNSEISALDIIKLIQTNTTITEAMHLNILFSTYVNTDIYFDIFKDF